MEMTTMAISLRLDRAGLLLIDLQRDFVHPDGLAARRGLYRVDAADLKRIVESCNKLIDVMHRLGRPVVFVKQVLRPDHADALLPPGWARLGLDAESGFLA